MPRSSCFSIASWWTVRRASGAFARSALSHFLPHTVRLHSKPPSDEVVKRSIATRTATAIWFTLILSESWSCFALTRLARVTRSGMRSRSEFDRLSAERPLFHQSLAYRRSGIMNEWAIKSQQATIVGAGCHRATGSRLTVIGPGPLNSGS